MTIIQNEIAGRETGSRAWFLRDGPNSEDAKRKEGEAQRVQDRLVELLNDPIYRAKYDGVLQLLSDTERATEAAIDQLTTQLQNAETVFAEMTDKAARSPDGTPVFRDANGIVRREDGVRVEDHLADTILWIGQEPSFENFHAARERIHGLQGQLDAANGYDDGRETENTYTDGVLASSFTTDVADQFIWNSLDKAYDASGVQIDQTTDYDNGRLLETQYSEGVRSTATMTDVDDVYAWTSYNDTYDAIGDLATRTTFFDDGREVFNDYMA